MANEQTPQTNYDQFRYALVGARALERKNTPLAETSLEKLAGEMGILDSSAKKAFARSYPTDKARSDAMNIYSSYYLQGLQKLTVSDIYSRSSDYYEKYFGDQTENILKEFGDETFEDISKKVEKANEIVKSETGNFTKKKKEEAKKTLEKYGLIYNCIAGIELDRKISELSIPLEEESMRNSFSEKYKPEEQAA